MLKTDVFFFSKLQNVEYKVFQLRACKKRSSRKQGFEFQSVAKSRVFQNTTRNERFQLQNAANTMQKEMVWVRKYK